MSPRLNFFVLRVFRVGLSVVDKACGTSTMAAMNIPGQQQLEIPFGSNDETGLEHWRAQRQMARRQLAQKFGLPIDHMVEVWLKGEIRLRGMLRLTEEKLFVPDGSEGALSLTVDGISFLASEIESCLRMD